MSCLSKVYLFLLTEYDKPDAYRIARLSNDLGDIHFICQEGNLYRFLDWFF